MTNTPLLALLLVAASGVAIALQSPLNAALGRYIGSSLGAATISFGVGFVLLLVVTIAYGDGGRLLDAAHAPRILLTGGLLGAFLVWATLYSVSVLGVLTMAAVLILGQILAALAIDHVGLFGIEARPVSINRLLAAGLVAAGVVLSRY
ncbi:DMT family transporter [Roseovarius sp. A21]|uniref:DMT family transporter n=1 Tax=Roseovarius bejariae TaxID=2576383 RepID=A0A844CLR9_9RHOB|nr:DMT family transporter [Roseovarius bejariae]MRU14415.1 DMT family transporter [Roseovarius bejariae]